LVDDVKCGPGPTYHWTPFGRAGLCHTLMAKAPTREPNSDGNSRSATR
jgi:hypothetical protein